MNIKREEWREYSKYIDNKNEKEQKKYQKKINDAIDEKDKLYNEKMKLIPNKKYNIFGIEKYSSIICRLEYENKVLDDTDIFYLRMYIVPLIEKTEVGCMDYLLFKRKSLHQLRNRDFVGTVQSN